jgi:hypothetical protein
MKEPEQVQQKARGNRSTAITATRWIVVIMSIFILLAFAGVILGAINFVSPTIYPAWLLAAWLVIDILLVIVVAGHVAIYVYSASDDMQVILAVAGIIGFIVAVGILIARHFAWISAAALILLIVFTVIDVSVMMSHE